MPDRLVTATIDLSAYAHNLRQIRALLKPETALMAIVKANAYGHGIIPIARAAIMSGATYIGVASLGEAKQIRNAGILEPILILNYIDTSSLQEAIELDVTITVMDIDCAKALLRRAKQSAKKIKVHLKIDTGMHRAGCDPQDAPEIAQLIHGSDLVTLEGIFTHFADADNRNLEFTQVQLRAFHDVIRHIHNLRIYPTLIHAANSAATMALPTTHFNMVRPGILSYGMSPFAHDHPLHDKVRRLFRPTLSLTTSLVHIRTIEKSETVGYGRSWEAKRKSRVGLLPIGYGDGFRRTPHSGGYVLIGGNKAPIIGRISMDQTTIDITDIPHAQVSDDVVLIGSQGEFFIDAGDLAAHYQSINYEVTTALSDRIVRSYIPI